MLNDGRVAKRSPQTIIYTALHCCPRGYSALGMIQQCHRRGAAKARPMPLSIWTYTNVKVCTLDIVPLCESSPQKCSGMAHVFKGSQFYLHTHTFIRNGNEPYLPLPSQQCTKYLTRLVTIFCRWLNTSTHSTRQVKSNHTHIQTHSTVNNLETLQYWSSILCCNQPTTDTWSEAQHPALSLTPNWIWSSNSRQKLTN